MKTLRVAICLLLIVGVLAMSLSVFAVDWNDRVVAQEYLWAYYIYQFLHSIGIDVTYRGILEYTDEVQDTIIDWVIAYIADLIEADSQPSNYSIAQWIAPWQADYDYWGNLQYNSTMLEDMQDFAEWLKSELGLIDNSSVVINPVYSVDGYSYYREGVFYPAVGSGTYVAIEIQNDATSNTVMGYFMMNNLNVPESNPSGKYAAVIIALNPTGNMEYLIVGMDSNGQTLTTGSGMSVVVVTNDNGFHYGIPFQTMSFRPEGQYFEYSSNSERDAFLQNFTIEQQGDVEVVTADIVLPIENPDYAHGDGVTIVDGVPQYGVLNIDNVTVDNLPAIITQNTIPDVGNDVDNPGFSVPWQAVNGLIQYVAAPAGAIMAIVNEAPVEGVIMLYALIGGMIIFGMIRIMREH